MTGFYGKRKTRKKDKRSEKNNTEKTMSRSTVALECGYARLEPAVVGVLALL